MGAGPGRGLIELHWGTFAGEWLRRTAAVDNAEIRRRAQPVQVAGCDAWTLAPEDAAVQLAVHIAVNHQMSYPGMRGLLDVALLTKMPGMDWAALAERAQAWRLSTCTWLVLTLTAELLGLDGAETASAACTAGRTEDGAPPTRRCAAHAGRARYDGRAGRLAFQLLLVDRPIDAARLVGRTLWPEPAWLRSDTGRREWGCAARHLAGLVRGRTEPTILLRAELALPTESLVHPQRGEGALNAVVGADAVADVRNLALLVDQEVRTDDAHVGLAVLGLLTPDAVRL